MPAARIKVESELKKRIISMLDRTWSQIEPDAAEFVNEEKTKKGRVDTIVEFCTDADRYKMFGDDKEAADIFDRLLKEDRSQAFNLARQALAYYA